MVSYNILSQDIVDYIKTGSVITTGTGIYWEQMPETTKSADNTILVMPYGGSPSDIVSELEFPKFQVMVKSLNYSEAYNLSSIIKYYLHQKTDVSINGVVYHRINFISGINYIGKDPQFKYTFTSNYEVIKRSG